MIGRINNVADKSGWMMNSFLLQWFSRNGPWSREEVSQAVERLIDSIDPKLRLLPRCQQQLRRGVRDTLRYTSDLIAHLPAPLDLSPAGYTTDRRVGLVFSSPETLWRVLQASDALREFFSRPSNPDDVYILLVMQPLMQSRLGSVLLPDGQVQNDVAQQVISFDGHRVLAVYDTLAQLQQQAGMEAFDALGRDLARRISLHEARRQLLEAEKQRVQLRLAAAGQVLVNAGALHAANDVADAMLPQRLKELNAEIAMLGERLSLGGKFDYVRQVLRQPQRYLRGERESACLDRMGVVTDVAAGGARLDFGLLQLGQDDVRERVVFPARVSRQDLRQWQERLAQF